MNNRAIYAGSFDPITNGHVDIIERASELFDLIYVSVLDNPDKQSLFSVQERIELIQELYQGNPKIKVQGFSGLLVHYAESIDTYTLLRGLRAVSDFDYEFQLSHTNRLLNQKIETVFLMTSTQNSYLSSSIVKQLSRLQADISRLVPASVAKRLKGRFS